MKLDKIYTRTGDEGKTSLGDGSRLPKFHLRVTAYGSIDEANSVIGVANLHVENPEVFQLLRHIQNDLFDVGADLCRPERPGAEKPCCASRKNKSRGWKIRSTDSTRTSSRSIALCFRAEVPLRLTCITRER